MTNVFFIAAAVALVGAAVTGLLGFVVYPRRVAREAGHRKAARRRGGSRGRSSKHVSPAMRSQGFSRAMFIVFAAAVIACGFFGLVST